jgi:hypothetical protein
VWNRVCGESTDVVSECKPKLLAFISPYEPNNSYNAFYSFVLHPIAITIYI